MYLSDLISALNTCMIKKWCIEYFWILKGKQELLYRKFSLIRMISQLLWEPNFGQLSIKKNNPIRSLFIDTCHAIVMFWCNCPKRKANVSAALQALPPLSAVRISNYVHTQCDVAVCILKLQKSSEQLRHNNVLHFHP